MNLLDMVRTGGEGILAALNGLATPNVAGDPAMLEMMTPEQREAAQKQARLAGLAGIQEGAAKGAPWYEMTTRRDFRAQPAYTDFISGAVSSVEELRKRRDAEGRRQKVSELVSRISNPEDPLSDEYSPEQIAVLGALTSDEQSALLAKTAFPKESGINVATAGTVQGGRFKLGNGNIGAMVQTGDPANPVKIIDTGQPYVSEDPSSIRELAILLNRPDLLQVAEELEKRKKTGTETGAANVAALKELPPLIATNQRHIEQLKDLRSKLAVLDSGALTGRVLQQFSEEFQTAQAMMYEEALLQIGALKSAGASLNPITEKELAILFTTSPKLTNRPEANLNIIDTRIRRIQRVIDDLQQQVGAARGGDVTTYDPTIPQGAPTYAPTQPGSVANPPPGGPGSVSKIPTIKRPPGQ